MAEKNSLRLEEEKLAEIEVQVAKCTIRAPRDGVVKYAHTEDRRGSEDFIVEEGAVVRERQVLIRMANTTSMRVAMTINESLVQYVEKGMPAAIRPVGAGGEVLRGEVEYVNQYAEPSGWRKANVKEYKAYVRVESPSESIRSGMTASVSIRSAYQPDVLLAPVQAVYIHGDTPYCFVRRGDRLEPRAVVCGPTNDKFFVIEKGLEEADQIAVNPRALADAVQLPEIDSGTADRIARQDPFFEPEAAAKPGAREVAKQPAAVSESATAEAATAEASEGEPSKLAGTVNASDADEDDPEAETGGG